MALGTSVAAQVDQTDARFVAPISVVSRWVTVIDPTGMDDVDAATITNPDTQITLATRHLMNFKGNAGTLVSARMAYAGTPSVNPIIVAFGRVVAIDGSNGTPWEILPNLQATTTTAVTLTTAVSTDISDGTLFYTLVDPLIHIWDRRGNNQVLFGIQTAYAVSAGSAATAFLQAKAL